MAAYLAEQGRGDRADPCLATELGADNITVNVIAPGLTLDRYHGGLDRRRGVLDGCREHAHKRTQEPEDLVGLVSFLAADDSAFMTGQTLMVDGGLIRL